MDLFGSFIDTGDSQTQGEELWVEYETTGTEAGTPAHRIVTEYLLERSKIFRDLLEKRQKGWQSSKGDEYFKKRRYAADNADAKAQQRFYKMTKRIGAEMQESTKAFTIKRPQPTNAGILDMGSAPGGFLAAAMKANPRSDAMALSLPPSSGGYKVLAPENLYLSVKYVDVTLMAADLGVLDIPADHPDALQFPPKQLEDGQKFVLVICGSSVVRNHHVAAYRQGLESCRLIMAQLVLGLERLTPEGTMILLLHKPEAWPTVRILYRFQRFSSIKLFKPKSAHGTRSSFYMVASNVQSQQEEAILALAAWKKIWYESTFGTPEKCREAFREGDLDVHKVLAEYGTDLIRMSKPVWSIQKDKLSDLFDAR